MMTSWWRHFRVVVKKSYGTTPPCFKIIGHSLIWFSENRVFDDVIMTSQKFHQNSNIYSWYRSWNKRNFENISFCLEVTCKRSVESQKLNNSLKISWWCHDDIILNFSITLPCLHTYQVSNQSDLQLLKYRHSNIATLRAC